MSDEVLTCFNKDRRDFLLSVTIHKARNLSVLNADTLVKLNFNGETKETKVFQNSDCPFFNEVCLFKIIFTSRSQIKFSVFCVWALLFPWRAFEEKLADNCDAKCLLSEEKMYNWRSKLQFADCLETELWVKKVSE